AAPRARLRGSARRRRHRGAHPLRVGALAHHGLALAGRRPAMKDEALTQRKGPAVTPELAAEHGLTDGEHERVVAALGREPTYTELGVVSVMWSEHCSYKSSRLHLGKLPSDGPQVIEGPG